MNNRYGNYRISKLKNNGFKEEEGFQRQKLAHSFSSKNIYQKNTKSSHFKDESPNKSNKIRVNSSAKNLGQRFVSKSNVMQFNDVKWLSIISAYDPKKLKFVTASRTSYEKFLKADDIRQDQFKRNQFKVILQNFKKWAKKINKEYAKVLNTFLYPSVHSSPIEIFAQVRPLLQKVRNQAEEMQDKVQHCIRIQDFKEFHGLLNKFNTFFQASKDIESIIYILHQSKNNIDDLFQDLERDTNLQRRLERQRRRGLSQVRKAVRDYPDDQAQNKILNSVQSAINEMTDKTLEAYHKLQGARHLIQKIQLVFAEKRNESNLSLNDIIIVNKIFQEVLFEASQFERFSEKFLQQSNSIINDDLRSCIERYLEEVQQKKKVVLEMELGFITNIIEITIDLFHSNYSICKGIESQYYEEYKMIDKLLEDICNCLCDHTKRSIVEEMIEQMKKMVRSTQQLVIKVKMFDGKVHLDTNEDLERIKQIQTDVTSYKQLFRKIIKKQQKTSELMNKGRKKYKSKSAIENDPELLFVSSLIKTSEKLNSSAKINELNNCEAYQSLNYHSQLKDLAEDLKDIKIVKWAAKGYEKFGVLKKENRMQNILKDIRLQNQLFSQSSIMVELSNTYSESRSDLLNQLSKIASIYSKLCEPSSSVQRFYERSVALIVKRGLKKQLIELIQTPQKLTFPQRQQDIKFFESNIKYLKIVGQEISGTIADKKIKNGCEAMRQMIEGSVIAQELKWNKDGKYYLENKQLFAAIDKAFDKVFYESQIFQVKQLVFCLGNCIQNLQNLFQNEKSAKNHPIRTQKLLKLVTNYERWNEELRENLKELPLENNLLFYSKMAFYLTQYIHQTNQSGYFVLNSAKEVLWLCLNSAMFTEFSGIGKKLKAEKMEKGQIVQNYSNKIHAIISARPRTATPIRDSNTEEFDVESDDNEEDFDNQKQDMDENIEQNEMEEEMEDEAEENQLEDDEIIEDQETQKVTKNTNKQVNKQTKKEKKKEEKQAQLSFKQQKKIKEKKVEHIYEKLAIETIEELKTLIDNLQNLEEVFWSEVSLFDKMEKHMNKGEEKSLDKELKEFLDKFCKQKFRSRLLAALRESEKYKKIVKSIELIVKRDKEQLSRILHLIGKRFSKLLNRKSEILWFSVQKQYWKSASCLSEYFNHFFQRYPELKQIGEFQIESYLEQLKKKKNGPETNYSIMSEELCPNQQMIKHKMGIIKKCRQLYAWNGKSINLGKYPDGLNIKSFILSLWHNAVSSQKNDIHIPLPKKIQDDIKILQQIQKAQQFLYHFPEYNKDCIQFLRKLRQHHKILENISLQSYHSNILDNIITLCEKYECPDDHVITYKKTKIFVNSEFFILEQNGLNDLQKLILKLLTVPGNNSAESIHGVLKKNSKSFTKYETQIAIMLQVLSVETHFFKIENQLVISEHRKAVLERLVKESSSSHISNMKEFDETGINHLEDQLLKTMKNHNQKVHEYVIKENSIFDKQLNSGFQKKLEELKQEYSKRYQDLPKIEESILKCLILRIFHSSKDEDEVEKIQSFFEKIQQMQKNQIIAGIKIHHIYQYDFSLYRYHLKTKETIENIEKKLKHEKEIIQSIMKGDINQENEDSLCFDIHQNFEKLLKWYSQERGGELENVHIFKVCQCKQKCNKSWICYVSFKDGNIFEDLLSNFSTQAKKTQIFLKGNLQQQKKGNYKEVKVLHLGKVLKNLKNSLQEGTFEIFNELLRSFNQHHFIKSNEKNLLQKQSSIEKVKKQQIELLSSFIPVQQKLKQQNILLKMLYQYIEIKSFSSVVTEINGQMKTIQQLSLTKITYEEFVQFYEKIREKAWKNNIYHLNSSSEKLICLLPKQKSIESALQDLSLPNEHEVKEMKVYLKDENYKIKIITQIQKGQWQKLYSENFGIEMDPSEETLILAICQNNEEQETIEAFCQLQYEQLVQNYLKLQTQMSSRSLKKNLSFKILRVKQSKQLKKQNTEDLIKNVEVQEKVDDAFVKFPIHLKEIGKFMENLFFDYLKHVQKMKGLLLEEQAGKYLKVLYSELEKADVYALPENEVKKAKKQERKLKMNSDKSIKEDTQKVIKNTEKQITSEELQQFSKMSEFYINSLENLLLAREQFLDELIKVAKRNHTEKRTIPQFNNTPKIEELMKQLKEHEQYEKEIEDYLKSELANLKGRKKQIVFMGHKK